MFKSTHKLSFEVADWITDDYKQFRIGTMEGLWVSTKETYDILALKNNSKGNGHFQDVFDWFENSCRRDKKDLRILEVDNKRLRKHLVNKRGFKCVDNVNNNYLKCLKYQKKKD